MHHERETIFGLNDESQNMIGDLSSIKNYASFMGADSQFIEE